MSMKFINGACALGLLFASNAFADSSIEETRSMPMEGLVQVENTAGLIEIIAWDKAELSLTGELGDDVEELEIEQSTSGVQIRVKNRKNQRNVDESHLYLKVPVSARIEAESISADISIEGLQTESIVMNSVSGDLLVKAQTQRLEAESVSGDVTFQGSAQRASVETVSGEIEVQGVGGEVKISTVSGDLTMSGAHVERARFETVSGDLDIELDVMEGGRLNAESMSGDFRLVLPTGQQAEFTAQTYSGSIRSDFGEASEKSHGAGSTLSHREGNNGATVRVESFSGDIRIESE